MATANDSILILLGVLTGVLGVIVYLWTSLALAALFRKVGEAGWQGWVPFLNVAVVLRVGGFSPWLVLLALVPGLGSAAVAVLLVIAAHRIGRGFGAGVGMTVLAALVFVVWASILGFGPAQWRAPSPEAVRRGVRSDLAPPPWVFSPPMSEQPGATSTGPVATAPAAASPAASASRGGATEPSVEPEVDPFARRAPLVDFQPAPWAPAAQPSPFAPPAEAAPSADERPRVEAVPAAASADDEQGGPDVPPTVPVAQVTAEATPAAPPAPAATPAAMEQPTVVRPAAPAPATAPPVAPLPAAAAPATPAPAAPAPAQRRDEPTSPDDDSRWPSEIDDVSAISPSPFPSRAASDRPGVVPSLSDAEERNEPVAGRRTWDAVPAPTSARRAFATDPDEFPEMSGEVSAIVGAPVAGAPRAAQGAVPAQLRRAEVDDELAGVDHTVVVARRRAAWQLVPPAGAAIPLTSDVVIVGRQPGLDPSRPRAQLVALDDRTRTVSKTHARLELRSDVWHITDLHSTNGVVLTGFMGSEIELEPGSDAPAGERFLLGDAELRIERPGA